MIKFDEIYEKFQREGKLSPTETALVFGAAMGFQEKIKELEMDIRNLKAVNPNKHTMPIPQFGVKPDPSLYAFMPDEYKPTQPPSIGREYEDDNLQAMHEAMEPRTQHTFAGDWPCEQISVEELAKRTQKSYIELYDDQKRLIFSINKTGLVVKGDGFTTDDEASHAFFNTIEELAAGRMMVDNSSKTSEA